MAFLRKIWKDRITEYPNRRLLTKEDGSTELMTIAREEGEVSQEGDAFSGENMNDLETRIGDEFDKINSNLEKVNVYVGEEDGKLHFVDSTGADSVLPFNKNDEVLLWEHSGGGYGQTVSMDLSKYEYLRIIVKTDSTNESVVNICSQSVIVDRTQTYNLMSASSSSGPFYWRTFSFDDSGFKYSNSASTSTGASGIRFSNPCMVYGIPYKD